MPFLHCCAAETGAVMDPSLPDVVEAVVSTEHDFEWASSKRTNEECIDAVAYQPFRITLSAASDNTFVYRFADVYAIDERTGCEMRSNGIVFSRSIVLNPFDSTPWPTAAQAFEFLGRASGRYCVVFDKMCHGCTVPVKFTVVVRAA